MSATLTISILLGLAALATSVFGIVTQVRDRGRSVARQEAQIELDETTRIRLAAEAAQIGEDQRIATERWWKEQFDAVRVELVSEQRRVRRLSKWAAEHQVWDTGAWERAVKTDPTYPPPPILDPEDA